MAESGSIRATQLSRNDNFRIDVTLYSAMAYEIQEAFSNRPWAIFFPARETFVPLIGLITSFHGFASERGIRMPPSDRPAVPANFGSLTAGRLLFLAVFLDC